MDINKIIIPEVEIVNGPIPQRPFSTKKRSVQVDNQGIIIESKKYEWNTLQDTEVDFYLGNPYIQLTFANSEIVSLFFHSKWYKIRRNPWYSASDQITLDFVEKIGELTNNPTIKDKILFKINNNNTISSTGKLYHSFFNLVFIMLPILALALLLAFINWVLNSPGGIFEF